MTLFQKITDICFEEGEVTKPMVERLLLLFEETMLDIVYETTATTDESKALQIEIRNKVKDLR